MKKKDIIFQKFSTNLRHILNYWNLRLENQGNEDIYFCPLIFRTFSKNGPKDSNIDQLTIEHVPPESLGGKGVCLTNHISNNSSGHSYDISISDLIYLNEFNEGISGFKRNCYLENIKLNFTLEKNELSNPTLIFKYKQFHPGIAKIFEKMENKETLKIKVSMPLKNRKADISLLRIAYLFAFSNIGYALLFGINKAINPSYKLVREQIEDPEIKKINDVVFLDKNLGEIPLGVNIIYEPKDYKCLLVVFNLKTENKLWKYGVFLPGPDNFGFQAISNIKMALKENKLHFKCLSVPKIDITDFDESVLFYQQWEALNGITV